MTLTIEQKAIREFLAKPVSYGGACACMGPREIPGFELKEDPYIIKLLNEEQRTNYILFIKNYFKISMNESKEKVDKNKVGFDNPYICEDFVRQANRSGINVEIKYNPTGLEPFCSCAMYNVVQIEDNYYKVTENRSADGITHDVVCLGKVGGPYKKECTSS